MSQLFTTARATGLAALISLSPVWAQDEAPKYPGQPGAQFALPRGWHRGGEVDIEIVGKGLFAPKDLLFYKPGIEVVKVEELLDRPMDSRDRYNYKRKIEDQFRKKNKGQKFEGEIDYPRKKTDRGSRVRARLKIKGDADLGEYPFRLVAGGGLSSLMTFWVGKFPTVEEAEAFDSSGNNDEMETAEPLRFGQTVNGYIARYDKDVYKVTAKAGQRMTFEVEGARLATYDRGDYLDVQLSLHAADGEQLAAADDSALHLEDPYFSVLAPADGAYFLTVEESVPSGSSSLLPYRLHVTDGTRPAMFYPAGGKPGETLTATAILSGEEPVEQKFALPNSMASATVSVTSDKAAPSGNLVRVFPGANVLEAEPNNAADQATSAKTAPPVALNGRILEPGDTDVFRVALKKDKAYTVQLFSSALGSPLDARMSIAPADKPNKRKRFEDSDEEQLDRLMVSTVRDRLDPAGVFTPDAAGDYLIEIDDSRGTGGADCVYRVEIAEASSGVLTYIVPPRNNEPRKGNRVQISPGSRYSSVIALRNAFGSDADGEFELVAEGLPKGVKLIAPKFGSSEARLPVVFEAASWVKPVATLIDLRARPVGGKPLPGGFRSTVPFNSVGGNNYMYYQYLDRLALAVTDGAPFKVTVEHPKATLTQDGELALQVRVDRQPGFEEPIEINAEWLPPNSGRPSPITIAPDEDSVEYVIGARRNTPPQDYRISLTAISRTGDRRTGDGMYFASSDLVHLKVSEPYLSAKMPRAAVEIGKTAQFVAKLEHIKAFKGKATAKLGRLPVGVEMVGGPVEIKPGQEELTFTVRATETALTGSYRGMFCALEFTENGQTVSQRSGYGTLRIDAKRGKKRVAVTK